VITLPSLVKAYGKARQAEGAEAVFAAMMDSRARARDVPVAPAPLGAATAAALEAGAAARAAGSELVRPNEFTYAEVMRAQLRASNYRRVLELHARAATEFAHRPLKPRTLNLALRAQCADSAQLRPALRLYAQMRKQGAGADAHARHALVGLCAARGRHQLADRIASERSEASG
jgi:pentatricopeptide repeat protein